ncbi:protein ADM2a [Pundamilia nyererei]|uniref:ADM2 n=1 Tax=Pundamilia nyererei TaxID=303518 RepID=A0A3B4GTL9_9CICH|nr:PREDICTED: ADM2 [Pundamilia nyererei]
MRFFFPLTVYCISLLSLQQALPAEERPATNRLDVLNKLIGQKEDNAPAAESQTISTVPSSALSRSPNRLPGFMKQRLASGARTASPALAWARSTEALQVERRAPRARRHAHSRGGHHNHHHAKLMRVGCVLGTCQVQNLSHRLYQLIGQTGREDSSPINPRSPHSFG